MFMKCCPLESFLFFSTLQCGENKPASSIFNWVYNTNSYDLTGEIPQQSNCLQIPPLQIPPSTL